MDISNGFDTLKKSLLTKGKPIILKLAHIFLNTCGHCLLCNIYY